MAAQDAGADLREGVRLRAARRQHGGWRVVLGNGDEVAARTLVDATGRAATAARSLGARRERRDRLVALFASAPAGAADVDARTLVEAVADGWWYTALVPGRRRVAVRPDRRRPAGARRPHRGQLRPRARGHRARAHARRDDRRRAADRSPRTSALCPPCGEGWLAAGDAALACDPLSSQGITTALYSGLDAGRALDAYLSGDGDALDRYAQGVAMIAAAYERNRRAAYAAEWRWRERPFWARRR